MKAGKIAYTAGSEDPIAAYDEFREAAEAVKAEDFPEVIFLSDGGIAAIRLDSIDEPAAIPLNDVRDRLVADWTAVETRTALHTLANRLKPGLENGGDLSVLGLDLTPVENASRGGFIEALPPSAILEVFKLDKGKVAVIDAGDKVALVRLTAITDVDLNQAENASTLDRVKKQLNAQVSFDLLDYFSKALQTKAGVTLNRQIISQVNAQASGF
jgi:peptidyl-prolyl cis-trans isomerase D